jgi:hypothetical protein
MERMELALSILRAKELRKLPRSLCADASALPHKMLMAEEVL